MMLSAGVCHARRSEKHLPVSSGFDGPCALPFAGLAAEKLVLRNAQRFRPRGSFRSGETGPAVAGSQFCPSSPGPIACRGFWSTVLSCLHNPQSGLRCTQQRLGALAGPF